jgi:hypothetical protein
MLSGYGSLLKSALIATERDCRLDGGNLAGCRLRRKEHAHDKQNRSGPRAGRACACAAAPAFWAGAAGDRDGPADSRRVIPDHAVLNTGQQVGGAIGLAALDSVNQ